jgi:tetratricopeptide (TPR) repeat protein
VRAINAFDLEQASDLLAAGEPEASPTSLYYLTRVQVLRGNLSAAGEPASRCVERWPDSSLCHEAKGELAMVMLVVEGNVFKQLGESRTARHHLERSVALDPDNLRARMLLVRYYSLAPWFAGGSKRKASAQVRECEQRDPYWGHETAALLALAEGRFADAIERFRQAQALQPEARDPAVYLAKAYSQAGDTDAAIEVLERLVERYPRFHEGWLELGKLAAERGVPSPRGTAALEHFLDNSAEAAPEKRAEANIYLGQLHAAAGRMDLAAAAFAAALALEPGSRQARKAMNSHCQAYPEIAACI